MSLTCETKNPAGNKTSKLCFLFSFCAIQNKRGKYQKKKNVNLSKENETKIPPNKSNSQFFFISFGEEFFLMSFCFCHCLSKQKKRKFDMSLVGCEGGWGGGARTTIILNGFPLGDGFVMLLMLLPCQCCLVVCGSS